MDSTRSVSIVFPAFNEENNLASVILAALSYLSQRALDYRLIMVNDGSSDRTGEIAAQLAQQDPEHLIVVTHAFNRGYGAAVRSGFAAACQTGCEWVVLMDADGQFDIRELDLLLDVAGDRGIDLVAGNRVKRADSAVRRLNAWLWSSTSRHLLGIQVHDIDCAFKLINRRVLETISLQGEAAVISPEILAKTARAGFVIAEVPVSHYPRHAGEQSGANLKVIARSLVGLVQLRLQLIGNHHPKEKPRARHATSR